jgi:polysaccharide pyruvyl transferase WcaK-like protein
MVLFFSDNRTTSNWGCRATSLAMADLMESIGIQYESAYGATKRHIAHSIQILGKRILISPRAAARVDQICKRILGKRVLLNPSHSLFKKLDFNSEDPNTSLALFEWLSHRDPVIRNLKEKIHTCECMVINGEGDMIFDPNRRTIRFMLLVMEYCQHIGKPVHFLNAMVSDPPSDITPSQSLQHRSFQALARCASVQLRDMTSYNIVKQRAPHVQCQYVPDALFTWNETVQKISTECLSHNGNIILPFRYDTLYNQFDFEKPYICIGGSSLAPRGNQDQIVRNFIKLCERLKDLKIGLFLVKTCSGDQFLDRVSCATNIPVIPLETPILLGASVLARASLFISGRYHPSIMASLGGTPLIMLDSNSHKSVSLLELLGYESAVQYPIRNLHAHIDAIFHQTESILGDPDIRSKILHSVGHLSKQAKMGIQSIFNR